ncbi:hypothetical protein BDV30DRAFT_232899 [Aspergillus minisclerotigenes]|uniref:BTB domain-containing protein n=1 Tax=Aspergillus minisclerotigenes TaxID=656917 RepID=A0A5N6JPR1_9EURO|nr:hypothetical protein BDV30DRAFT_232899 [Aspergillus minisclerotigenes]
MPDILYEFDPDGDVTFIIENAPGFLPHNLSDLNAFLLSQPYSNTDVELAEIAKSVESPSLHIRASSNHLMLASPQFKRTFQHGFKEGTELRSAGHVEVPICDWKPLLFLLLMAILHGQNQLVPRRLCMLRLTEMAVLVDYYECYEAVAIVFSLWVEATEKERPRFSTKQSMEWLCITWVFQRGHGFNSITVNILKNSRGKITANNLPIPTKIIADEMQNIKDFYIGKVIHRLHDLVDRLQCGPQVCNKQCDLIRLGILVKRMHELGILSPTPEAPTTECSYKELYEAYYDMSSSFHHCQLMPEVLGILNVVDDLLNYGLNLKSFASLREKP